MSDLENSFEKIENDNPELVAEEQNVTAATDEDIELANEISRVNQENGENPDVDSTDLTGLTTNSVSVDNFSSNGLGNEVNGGKEPVKESEKIRIWREEQQKMLDQKDEEENKKKMELAEQAKKELEEWYSRCEEQLNKSKVINRNAEKEWIAERDAESPEQEWEKIARMCDFNPKASRNSKDTSRMRSILLQLKQQQAQEKSS